MATFRVRMDESFEAQDLEELLITLSKGMLEGALHGNTGIRNLDVRLDIDLPRSQGGSRRFLLDRVEDHSGVSGVGIVAEGVEFSDGVVALRWLVPPGQPGHGNPTSVVFHDNGMESVEKIHGHSGSTKVRWLDK